MDPSCPAVRRSISMPLCLSRCFALGVQLGLLVPAAQAQSQPHEKLAERARRAGEIIAELVKEPDHSPPQSLLEKATCVAAVPEVVQVGLGLGGKVGFGLARDRKSTRLNSSHGYISYAVFCLKKKKQQRD